MSDKKLRIGMYWCASCGGCEEAVVDLAEYILDLTSKVDIVFWPVAMDFKKSDVMAMQDNEIDLVMINGAIQLSEQEEMAILLRRKSKLVAAFGACAHLGGLPGLANQKSRKEIFDFYFQSAPSVVNEEKSYPDPVYTEENLKFDIPLFLDDVRSLDQVIDVDYYIPGCAPTPGVVRSALENVVNGNLPAKGSVLASPKALCSECSLNATKPDDGMRIPTLRRSIDHKNLDPETCFLTQGYLCLGPVTRGGCDSLCMKGNMPCTGCFGPMDDVKDFGAAALSYIASIVDEKDPEKLQKMMDEAIPDPLGTFYMYSLPKSLLYKNWQKMN